MVRVAGAALSVLVKNHQDQMGDTLKRPAKANFKQLAALHKIFEFINLASTKCTP
jgi:hypothetical protein